MGLFLCIGIPLSPGPATAQDVDGTCEPLTLKQAETQALANNPSLAAIGARYDALAAIPSQQSTLPDPVLSLGAINFPLDSFDLSQENMTQMQVGISQKFPFPGKLGLNEESAALEAEAALQEIGEAKLKLTKDIRLHWWDIFYLKKSLATIRSNQELLRATVAAARTKYEVGKGLQQDVLLAQLELTRLMDRELDVANAINKKRASLTALLGRASTAGCITVVQETALSLPAILPEATLQDLATANRPGLLALQKKTAATKARIASARKEYYPDFTVGASYGYRQDTPDGRERSDFGSIKVSMNLPIWTGSKLDNKVAQRTSESLAAEQKRRAFRDRIQATIDSQYSEYANTAKQSRLYKDSLIPQAEQTAAAMLKGYQVNKVDFLNVVRAQLALYNYKITYWHHLSSAQKALATLEAATGAPISEETPHE
jgi:outer membrane protein TolC